jgi:hypothetical protein
MSLIIILALSGVASYLAYRVWYLAGVIADSQDLDSSNIEYMEELELTNQYMYGKIVASYDKMQEIDRLGAFEKDDEAGSTFQLLNEVIQQLKSEFDNGESEEKK